MVLCSLCGRISGTGQDHIDCIEKRRVELEDEDFKNKIPERIDLSKNMDNLSGEIKAIMKHLSDEKK